MTQPDAIMAPTRQQLADTCRDLSAALLELSSHFDYFGGFRFAGHAPAIFGMSNHLSIYAHQLEASVDNPNPKTWIEP